MTTNAFEHIPLEQVRSFWNRRPCNIRHSPKEIGTKEYFDEVEARKYFVEPHIPRFAQFPIWKGKRVLELGCGIGTDTINFARAGAQVTAIDLSEKSLEIAQQRARVYGLEDKIRFYCADIERLRDILPQQPYDLVYSFGVIHHTPHPDRALKEIKYHMNSSSHLKLMLYHKYSWKAMTFWLTHGLSEGVRFEQSIAKHSEAQQGCPVTYAYSKNEARQLLNDFDIIELRTDHIFPYRIPAYRQHRYVREWYWQVLPHPLFRLLEKTIGWHLLIEAQLTPQKLFYHEHNKS